MAVVVGVRRIEGRCWEWSQILTAAELNWLPVDFELSDADGVECRAVGVGVSPPSGWVQCATGEAHTPRLPARVIR